MRSAAEHADAGKDSPLAFAEHLLDEAAAAYIEPNRLTDAIETVKRAIAICNEHEDIQRYQEVRFDAYLFLGRIYAMNHEYVKAEKAFAETDNKVERFALPLMSTAFFGWHLFSISWSFPPSESMCALASPTLNPKANRLEAHHKRRYSRCLLQALSRVSGRAYERQRVCPHMRPFKDKCV